ncbi:MAG: alkylhydroperoxidase family enzyme [Gammaproteobacteria bacterium]|jgi:alkylhydroperoxidase family enzyme
MTSVVQPVAPGTSDDPKVNELIQQSIDGWWHDSAMMGAIAHQPDLLKTILPVFESFFIAGRIPAHQFEMMRLKTGEINRCGYCMTVRAAGVVDEVGPKEEAFMGEIDESAFTRREYLGIKLAEYMAGDPNYIPDEFYDDLKEAYTKEEVVELIFACSVFNFGNKFNITMRLDTTEESDYEKEMAYPFVPKAAANG